MAQTVFSHFESKLNQHDRSDRCAAAAGLFGYSTLESRSNLYQPVEGYLRDLEQIPNFAPPSIDSFMAHYVASAIGKTCSSS